MKLVYKIIVLIFSIFPLSAQFSVENYQKYLNSHKDMDYQQLLDEFPAGKFLSSANADFSKSEYSSNVKKFLQMNDYDESLINKNGFLVTEKNTPYSFLAAYYYIYDNDLPVYISSDAILHAMHFTVSRVMNKIESDVIYNNLYEFLKRMKEKTNYLINLSRDSIFQKSVRDFDFYITTGFELLVSIDSANYEKPDIEPFFEENKSEIESILNKIKLFQPAEIKLFSTTPRLIDFSQFKPRGRYITSAKLRSYFKAMMWFGYVDILINDYVQDAVDYKQKEIDLRRQTLMALLLCKAADSPEIYGLYTKIQETYNKLIGKPDNITIDAFRDLFVKYGLSDITVFADSSWSAFLRYNIAQEIKNQQLYNSQILFSDIKNPQKVKLANSFKLFGQAAAIDGFITSNVVYDKITYMNQKNFRELPSTLDILFALGNDASIQLLEESLNEYKYSSNLGALRYLISAYDTSFWKSSVYNQWLNCIRSLNPPPSRKNLPTFMQTAAWWQKTFSTQLASWSQLRHDFLLSAKQPFSEGYMCSFPYGFVEPVPELYDKLLSFFELFKTIEPSHYELLKNRWFKYSDKFIEVLKSLKNISLKELNGENLNKSDSSFIQYMISTSGCVTTLDGWYVRLYEGYEWFQYLPFEKTVDNTVADVHTAPTDKDGNIKGHVLHCGTSYPNYAAVIWKSPDSVVRTYTGAVYNYYEQVTENFIRLTDDEWNSSIESGKAYHPSFCNLYLSPKGKTPNTYPSLFTEDLSEVTGDFVEFSDFSIFPNPAIDYIEISYPVGARHALPEEIRIYNVFGEEIPPRLTASGTPQEGNLGSSSSHYSILTTQYSAKIDVSSLPAGIYFVRVGGRVGRFVKI